MAYTRTYVATRAIKPDGTESEKTVLEARFRFYNEVAPKDKNEVYNRADAYMNRDISRMTAHKGLLGQYLTNIEKLDYDFFSSREHLFKYFFDSKDGKLRLVVKKLLLCKQPAFDLKMISSEIVPLEEMLDLDALNNFVLTGKKPERTSSSVARPNTFPKDA